jgi:hypothetical protein
MHICADEAFVRDHVSEKRDGEFVLSHSSAMKPADEWGTGLLLVRW